jgi:SnoaL-like protein
VTREQVQAWLDAYIDAWRTYEPTTIGELFSVDASYAYHPYDEPERGREAIVASWLREPDVARSWEASYAPLVVDGDRAVAAGKTVYTDGRRFSNLFVLRFDADGRCSEFVEWFIENPSGA